MKKIFLLLSLLLTVPLCAADPGSAEKPVSPYAPIAWFIGGNWVATLPTQKDGTTVKLELTFEWPANQQGLRFDSSFIVGGKRAPYSSGMYAWNAAKRKFTIFYTDSSGGLSEGDVTQEGDVFAHEFTATDKNGKVEPIRVRLTKVDADTFTNEIFVQKDGAWVKFVTARYERQK